MPRNQLCRFCRSLGPQNSYSGAEEPLSYASVIVGDVLRDIRLCESRLIPSFTTWCMECEKISFLCPDGFPDANSEGASVVHGPPTLEQTRVKTLAFEAQIVLWRNLKKLDLITPPSVI